MTKAQGYNLLTFPPLALPVEGALRYGYYFRCAGEIARYTEPVNYFTLKFKGQVLETRQEVREWLVECNKRKSVRGIKKWFRELLDKRCFKSICDRLNGNLAAPICRGQQNEPGKAA